MERSMARNKSQNVVFGLFLVLPRDAMRKRGTSRRPVPVCLSVCLLHSCVVSKWLKISSNFISASYDPIILCVMLGFKTQGSKPRQDRDVKVHDQDRDEVSTKNVQLNY